MKGRKSITVSTLAGSIALMLASSVWAVAFGIFTDTESYIQRAKEIVIVEVLGDADPRPPGDDPSTVDVNVLMSLKGERVKGRLKLVTMHMTEKGKRYLVRNPNGGLSELGLVQLSDSLKLTSLEGKALKQQATLIFEQRLNDVKAAQQRLATEQALLEYAVEPELHAPRRLKFATEVAR